MLTKYTLTIGSTTVDIPDECLKNWDEISFSLKRTDFSGVMRSFSTEFEFCGEIADTLWELYLTDAFLASASVSVYTFTNRWGWSKQFEEALDFSTIERSQGVVTINALDNTLAALVKAKKSQKYEYPVSGFNSASRIGVTRMELKSYAYWSFTLSENRYSAEDFGAVCMHLVENKSAVISKAYLDPRDESNGDDGLADNSFFMLSNAYHATCAMKFHVCVRCYLDQSLYGESRSASPHQSNMRLMTNTETEEGTNERHYIAILWNDNITTKEIEGTTVNMKFGGDDLSLIAGSLADLEAYSGNKPVGFFGIVGSYDDPTTTAYWENNQVYEWDGSAWVLKGFAGSYYQDRIYDFTYDLTSNYVMRGTYISLVIDKNMIFNRSFEDCYMHIDWSDPVENTLYVRTLTPLQLGSKIVDSIKSGATMSIDADTEGLIATTALVAGEELRQIPTAKIYCTFQQFCDFMECVFGYTYAIEGNNIRFAHRSALFANSVSKELGDANEVEYTVNDSIIYSTIEIGFAKKDYSEIDGRYEKNFMNYYETGISLTDKKYTLQSKFRADSYGIEFTARKSNSSSTDDKADEDIFIMHYVTNSGTGTSIYEPDDNDAYNPKECLTRNKAYLAALGNGKGVTFKMTSSDGDNALYNVVSTAGSNLFTCGELEFETEDMVMPSNVNALVQLDWQGYRYKGFISEVECRYGKLNGAKYKLILKQITEIT